MTWEEFIAAARAPGFTVRGKLLRRTGGGFEVDIGLDVTAFLHWNALGEVLSHDPAAREQVLEAYVGEELELGLLRLDKKTRSIDVSRKIVLDRERSRLKEELFKTLAVGQTREGVVKHVLEDRAFVDLGGIDAVIEGDVLDLQVGQRRAFVIARFNPDTELIKLARP